MLNEQQQAFKRVLALIDMAGCSEHVVLIGSWAEFVYHESGLLESFNPAIRTLDVDFLVKNLRKPNPPASLTALAKQEGFLIQHDRMYGTTKLFDTSGLEVEFLINKRGAGLEPTLETNIGVTAQALRHLDLLSSSSVEVPCLGHSVWVPVPEAYALHKMVINTQRNAKAEKDALAVSYIWPYLNRDKLRELMDRLSKKELAHANEFMEKMDLTLE